jgi:hypothetical protein
MDGNVWNGDHWTLYLPGGQLIQTTEKLLQVKK